MPLDIKSLLSHVSFPSHSTIRRSHGFHPTPSSSFVASVSKCSHGPIPPRPVSPRNDTHEPFPTRTMTMDDIIILKLLGRGACGHVYLAKDIVTGKHFALKVIKKEGRLPVALEGLVYEQRVQRMMSGLPGFVSLEASWHDENNFYLAMPFYAGGDLAFELLRCRTFESDRARFYMAELVLAIEKMHNMNVMHRDIKPGNIVFDNDGHVALADFGMAKHFECADNVDLDVSLSANDNYSNSYIRKQNSRRCVTNDVCGTPFFMSPEMHYGEDYSFDVDFWALGIVLYRMLTGRMAFGADAEDSSDMAANIAEEPLVFLEADNVDAVTQDLLHRLLAKNSRDRLTADEIKKHAYFNGIDWNQIADRKIDTPWKPYLHPMPKIPRTNLAFTKGRAYDAANDPYPTYQSFRPEFFVNKSAIIDNSKCSRWNAPSSRSTRSFLGISKKPSRASGLRNVIFSEKTTSRQQDSSNQHASGTSNGRSAYTKGGSGRARKSDSGMFRGARRWLKRLWMPKAKPLGGARVDLLA